MNLRIPQLLTGLGIVIALLAGLAYGVEHFRTGKGQDASDAAHVAQGEVNAHVGEATSIPDHKKELDQAAKDVVSARAEVARLRKLLAAKSSVPVSDPASAGQAIQVPVQPDDRDAVIAAQEALVSRLDAENGLLKVTLIDEKKRTGEYKLALEAAQRQAMAQEAATKAWKEAVVASKWRGRVEGFAAGIALGYVGGKL